MFFFLPVTGSYHSLIVYDIWEGSKYNLLQGINNQNYSENHSEKSPFVITYFHWTEPFSTINFFK